MESVSRRKISGQPQVSEPYQASGLRILDLIGGTERDISLSGLPLIMGWIGLRTAEVCGWAATWVEVPEGVARDC
jgi:hypothetical protein